MSTIAKNPVGRILESRKHLPGQHDQQSHAGPADLVGSDKQVTWAKSIRDSIHADVDRALAQDPESKRSQMAHDIVLPLVDRITSASWFIDNRDFDPLRVSKLEGGKPRLDYPPLLELRREAEKVG